MANNFEARCGGLLFTSRIDSGNLARVEKVSKDDDEFDKSASFTLPSDMSVDYEFNVWTKPDCGGTPYENGNRSWFHFGVRGGGPGRVIKINIMNLNRQGKLYSQGHSPLVKTVPGKPKWERIRDRPMFQNADSNFILMFTHQFLDIKGATTYFAFCFPWSYEESRDQLDSLNQKFDDQKYSTKSPPDQIYYHRECLCYSLDKLNIDLLTITDCRGIQDEDEPYFDSNLFPVRSSHRCKEFKGKRVYVVTSRVHPGETPASFVFNGFLEFILRPDDPRAKQLRKQFVFKMIPMLNPDGVVRGHYRTDTRGVNLNRMYLHPSFDLYPSIYATKSLLVFHHVHNQVILPKKEHSDYIKLRDSPSAKPCNIKLPGTNASSGATSKSNIRDKCSKKTKSTVISMQKAPQPLTRDKTFMVVHDKGQIAKNAEKPTNTTHGGSHSNQMKSNVAIQNEDSHCSVALGGKNEIQAGHLSQSMAKVTLADDQCYVFEQDLIQNRNCGTVLLSSDIASGGEFGDLDDEHLGNEGSEDEGENDPSMTEGVYAPNLSDPKLREISHIESGIAFYVDLHGHASKRGCFIYGNYFDSEDTQLENMLFPKLISLNTAHFDFGGCNFTERNMYLKDKKDGLSKEGAGRVAMYKTLGIIHSYTLECNYNTGRMVNSVPPAFGDNGRATPPPLAGFPPRYSTMHFEEVGRAMAIAALDITETNPWSRITQSEFCSLHGVQEFLRRHIRSTRSQPRISGTRRPKPPTRTQGSSGTNQFIPRVALLPPRRSSSTATQPMGEASSNSLMCTNNTLQRRLSLGVARREPGPVKERTVNPFNFAAVKFS